MSNEEKHMSWMSAARYLLFLIITSAVLTEVALAFFYPAPSFEAITISTEDAAYQLSPNPLLLYEPLPNRGHFNEAGYRGQLIPIERDKNKKRLMFIGDSVVEGLGVKVQERFSELIGKEVGDEIETINLAVRGYNFRQVVEFFKKKGADYRPDLLVLGVSYNDSSLDCKEVHDFAKRLHTSSANDFYRGFYSKSAELNKFLYSFNLYRHVLHIKSSRSKKRGDGSFFQSVRYTLSHQELCGLVRELVALSLKKQFKMLFVLMPPRGQRRRDGLIKLSNAIKTERQEIVDLPDMLAKNKELEDNDLLLPKDPCHLNPRGHKWVAEQLTPILKKKLAETNTIK